MKNILPASALIFFLTVPHLFAADNRIPTDVVNGGGGEGAKSDRYVLSDSIGEPIVGQGRSDDYLLESGYRKPSASEYLSMGCGSVATLGTLTVGSEVTADANCSITTDASSGYSLSWSVPTGSGGVNTGSLISEYNAALPPYSPAVANVPEPWSIAAADAEWGGRLKSSSTDTAAEWGTDASSEKFLNIAVSNRSIVTRSSGTPLAGSLETIQFKAALGASSTQAAGTYRGNVVMTVVSY